MRLFNRLSIFWLMFVLNLQPKFVKSLSNDDEVKVFSDYSDTYRFNHLVIDQIFGKVYIGAMNKLYKLSHNLELLGNVTTCSPFDPKNYNKILVADNLNRQLIFCGTSTKCPCSAYNFDDNSATLVLKQYATKEIALSSVNASTVAFISNTYDSPRNGKLFVAVSNNGCFFNSSAMAVRKLFPNQFLHMAYETSVSHVNAFKADYQHHCKVNYVYGFASGKYNYLLTTQLNYSAQKSAYVSKLIRVCDRQNSLLPGYTEIPIECKFHNISAYNLVQAATVGKPNPQLAKSLKIERDDDVLFAIFSKSKDAEATLNEPSDHSALCIYSLEEINKKVYENIKNCLKGNGIRGFGSLLLNPQCKKEKENVDIENFKNLCKSEVDDMPFDGNQPITKSPVITFNSRMTAIASKRNENHNDVFIGTNMGQLKYVKVMNSTSACELIDLLIDEGSPVNSDLLLSFNNESLFVMTEHKLTKIKIPIKLENCSDNENFDSCIQSTHNHCGWCESSNKCTTKCECFNNNHLFWYSHDFQNDIKIADRNSDKSLLNPGETLILNITNLPSVNDKVTLYCTFFFRNKILQTNATLFSNPAGFKVLSCSTPEEHEISMISPFTDNFIIKLAIRTAHFGDMATTNVTFSRCFSFTSCETCVSKKSECRWHFTKKECFYDSKITDVKSCESILPKRPPRTSPSITSFWPLLGPVEGGTNITIQVSSLTDKFEDIDKTIKVAGARCTPHYDMFVPMKMIGCGIENSTLEPDHEGSVEVQISGTSLVSEEKFKFVNPAITNINPNQGPVYGGTPVKIKGENLTAGRSVEAFVGKSCTVFSRNSSVIQCITQASNEQEANVSVKFDENTRRYLHNGSFKFVKDPLRDENGYNNEPKGIPAGGVGILIRNIDPSPNCQLFLRIHSESTTYNDTCEVIKDSKTWSCLSPSITDIHSDSLDAEKPRELNVSLECYFDNNRTIIEKIVIPSKFTLYPNPKFDYFISSSIECGEDNFIIIMGQNINKACQKTDINVTVVNHPCEVLAISSTQVICRLPKSFSSNSTHDSEKICNDIMEFNEITVSIGDEFNVTVFKQRNPPPNEPNYSVYIISVVIIFILLIILATHYLISKNVIATSLKKLKKTQQKMNNLELCVASECKEIFAELQTQATTFRTDNSCIALPFLNYHNYIMNILFPNTHDHSVIPRGNDILIHKEKGIQSFRRLIMNRTFLLSLLRSLESEQSFSMNDRVRVASMLMITLQKDMKYCTEILQTLLAELIEKNMRNGSHPKLLLRRTESIVEKMLSAWFYFLLYKFLKETAGQPLFNLFNVIKEHVNGGPVDMITSQARYCLSENKMLRQKIAFSPLTIYVNISQQTAEIFELESPIEKVPVEVLDCDTISQFKEKALDAISCKIKFNLSVDSSELNVEWFRDPADKIILFDDDSSSIIEGEWKRKNTLKYYKVPDGCVLNLISHEETKLPISVMLSDFNLRTPVTEVKSDLASLLHRIQNKWLTDPTTAPIQSNDVHYKEWHLVKPNDPQDEQDDHNESNQIIPEIFLTRLLGAKSSLLKFIDELFATIFNNTNQGNCVPIPIKYMFDFLDNQALLHNITDPEVVHVWKNNCLPLRFWVNLIKNPNFLFDVRKSNIVDSCLSVVAQVFMDSCSTSEQHLNKDSATTKLLFAKEIPIYNEMVKKYYADIKNMPKITSDDMNAMLVEDSKTYDTDFNTNASVYELLKYAIKYQGQLIEALKNDESSKKNVLVFEFEKLIKSMSDIPDVSDELRPVLN